MESGVTVIGWGDRASATTANFNAAFEACQHLIDIGCKRIACISPTPRNQNQFEERINGYQASTDIKTV